MQDQNPEFQNLLRLLESTERANVELGLQIAQSYQTGFEQHYGCSLQDYSELVEFLLKHGELDSETPLSKAKYLNLMDKGLYFLPLNIFMLSNLEKLLLLNNLFTEFPKGIDKLEHLRVLGLGKNKLTSVPASIGRLENLNFLSLEENQLVSIPKEIVNLQKLVLLDLTRNKITKLPDLIDANSQYPIDLLIAHNPLTELPISLKNVERCRIFIGENPLDPLRECVEGWNNVTFCDSRNDLPFD